MVATTKTLMTFVISRCIYGYTESDEISLLFSPGEHSYLGGNFANTTRR